MATPTSLPATFVAGNVLTAAQMNDLRGAFRILQVVSTTKTDSFSTTSTSFVDVTGLSASITPTSATSKVLVMLTAVVANSTGGSVRLNLVRDSTNIAQSTGSGSVDQTLAIRTDSANGADSAAVNYLDSPATTSATTYKVQIASVSGASSSYVGRHASDDNRRSIATLTVMEVSA